MADEDLAKNEKLARILFPSDTPLLKMSTRSVTFPEWELDPIRDNPGRWTEIFVKTFKR